MSAGVAFEHRPRIVLADDHPTVLSAVVGILGSHFSVVAAVGDGKAALQAAAAAKPDLVLLDVAMPGLDGFRTARELQQRGSDAKLVFLTGQDDDDYISEGLKAGARAYVFKRRMQTDLLPALNSALTGHFFISPHAFVSAQTHTPNSHILELYSNEEAYFEQVSERTCAVLAEGEQVFMFLSNIGLRTVTKRLNAFSVNWFDAINAGQFHVFGVENVVSLFMQSVAGLDSVKVGHSDLLHIWCSDDDALFGPLRTHQVIQTRWPDLERFQMFFSRSLNRAAAKAWERGAKVTIISDLLATLLREGCSHNIAAHIEEGWNAVIPSHSCVVYCGCPFNYLGEREKRLAISKICGEHSDLIRTAIQ